MEMERSSRLLMFMEDARLVPSGEEEIKRETIVNKLNEIVNNWIKRICKDRFRHPEAASAKILTYGSYGLGVHCSDSDIDALCVAPSFAYMSEDFFCLLHQIISCEPEVSNLQRVKGAKGPIIRFHFDGISVDLSFAKLGILYVPEKVNVDDPRILINMGRTSRRIFSHVFANTKILQLVPNIEFIGFLGGVHLAVLTAWICQRHPEDPLCDLILAFFNTFAFWPWPKPVSLDGTELPPGSSSTQSSFMRIQLPHGPYKYHQSSITRSAFYRIKEELMLGRYILTKDAPGPDFDWRILFRPFIPAQNYVRLVEIRLSTSHQDDLEDWVGFVKSRLHYLLVKLEELLYFSDPNRTQYVDEDFPEPNVVFYWGLHAGDNHDIDYGSIKEEFMTNIMSGYDCKMGKMELRAVKRVSVLGKTNIKTARKNIKTCWRVARSSSLC